MNKSSISIVLFFSIIVLANWGTSESNREHRAKPAVNFSGQIIIRKGKEPIQAENITINKNYRDIKVYDAPSQEGIKKEFLPDDSTKQYKALEKHPKDILATTKLDLSELYSIHIKNNTDDWIYKRSKQERGKRNIFVEIIATYKDNERTQKHYLIEEETKVYCDEENEAGAIEKVIPIKAINVITFEEDFDNDQDYYIPTEDSNSGEEIHVTNKDGKKDISYGDVHIIKEGDRKEIHVTHCNDPDDIAKNRSCKVK